MAHILSKLTFNKKYFIITIILLIVEILIGMYVKDKFIRPYGGDYLVVILLYTFIKSFWDESFMKVAIGVLIFSFVLEFLQYFNFVDRIGLGDIKLARILIGTSFAWEDLVAYALGVLTVIFVENRRQ